MQDLSSLTRYWTCIPCSGSTGSQSLDCQQSPFFLYLVSDFSSIYHTPSFLETFFFQFLYPVLSLYPAILHTPLSALLLAPLPLLTWPVLLCPRALSVVFLQVVSSCQVGFISHLYAVYTPAYITSRFSVLDRPKTELWLPPLPAPNLLLLVPSHQLTAAQSIWLLKSLHRSNPWFLFRPSLLTNHLGFPASHVISPPDITLTIRLGPLRHPCPNL